MKKILCSGEDCFKLLRETDVETNVKGEIYERSKKCWDCRTDADKKAIKKWRQASSSSQIFNG